MQSHQPERELSQDQIDNYAFQAASYQDELESHGYSVEDELSVSRMLFGALGPRNARAVTERMVEIRKDPHERQTAEEAMRRVWEDSQTKRN